MSDSWKAANTSSDRIARSGFAISVRHLFILGLIASFPSASAQQENDETKCLNAGTAMNDTSNCVSAVYRAVDFELNVTYKHSVQSASKYTYHDVENLRDAQRKWIVYRDAACVAESGLWVGGSGAGIAQMMCLIRITRQRIADLKNAYR